MEHEGQITVFCPYFHRAIEVIGRRWTGAILRALLAGKTRFSDLRASIPDLSDRMLSERLKELENEGIVERVVVPDTPVRIYYRLTPKGEALEGVIAAIAQWAHDWMDAHAAVVEMREVMAETTKEPHVGQAVAPR
ncbi:MAG: helix-turn-helix transcriptional regulator [Chloroflexi bacterium]|nr:helix-turn-helix transcriptional regulator [Chloroflexota bacterium]